MQCFLDLFIKMKFLILFLYLYKLYSFIFCIKNWLCLIIIFLFDCGRKIWWNDIHMNYLYKIWKTWKFVLTWKNSADLKYYVNDTFLCSESNQMIMCGVWPYYACSLEFFLEQPKKKLILEKMCAKLFLYS